MSVEEYFDFDGGRRFRLRVYAVTAVAVTLISVVVFGRGGGGAAPPAKGRGRGPYVPSMGSSRARSEGAADIGSEQETAHSRERGEPGPARTTDEGSAQEPVNWGGLYDDLGRSGEALVLDELAFRGPHGPSWGRLAGTAAGRAGSHAPGGGGGGRFTRGSRERARGAKPVARRASTGARTRTRDALADDGTGIVDRAGQPPDGAPEIDADADAADGTDTVGQTEQTYRTADTARVIEKDILMVEEVYTGEDPPWIGDVTGKPAHYPGGGGILTEPGADEVSPVMAPEPATLLLLVGGGAVLLVRRRRRRS